MTNGIYSGPGIPQMNGSCQRMCPVPFFYKGATQYALCILPKNHEGKHKTSPAYESIEWVETEETKP